MRRDLPISDPFLGLDFFAKEFNRTQEYLREISNAQRGGCKGKKFSQHLLASYPQFILGPGNSPGLYASQYREWREEQNVPIGRTA